MFVGLGNGACLWLAPADESMCQAVGADRQPNLEVASSRSDASAVLHAFGELSTAAWSVVAM